MEDVEITLQGLGFTQPDAAVTESLLNLGVEPESPFLNSPSPSEMLYWSHNQQGNEQNVQENSRVAVGGEE